MGWPPTAVEQSPSMNRASGGSRSGRWTDPEVEHADEQRRRRGERAAFGSGSRSSSTATHRSRSGRPPEIGRGVFSGRHAGAAEIRPGRRRRPRAGAKKSRRAQSTKSTYAPALAAGASRSARSPARRQQPVPPEVSTRSPTGEAGLSGRKRRASAELSPSGAAWSPELSTTTGMRELKSVISRGTGAALADVDHPADQALRGRSAGMPLATPCSAPASSRTARTNARRDRDDARGRASAARSSRRHGQHPLQRPVLHRELRASACQPAGAGSPRAGARSPRGAASSSPTRRTRHAGDDRAIEHAASTGAIVSRAVRHDVSGELHCQDEAGPTGPPGRRAPKRSTGPGRRPRGGPPPSAEASPSSPLGAARRSSGDPAA